MALRNGSTEKKDRFSKTSNGLPGIVELKNDVLYVNGKRWKKPLFKKV